MKPPKIDDTEAKILVALLRRGPQSFFDLRDQVPHLTTIEVGPVIDGMVERGLIIRRRVDAGGFLVLCYAPTPRGYDAMGRNVANRDTLIRRIAREYVAAWRYDWFAMTVAHVLLAATASLATLSAWGVIP